MQIRTIIFTLAATIAIAGAVPAGADGGAAQLKTAEKTEIGKYITDSNGRALYVFSIDSIDSSSCYAACAEAWRPLLTAEAPKFAAGSISEKLIGTMDRLDGGRQVTYNGRPLYRFAKENAGGGTAGQLAGGFGGKWFLISPDGNPIKAGAATN